MLKESAKKTKSAPKLLLFAAAFFLMAGAVGWLYIAENEQTSINSSASTAQKNEKLQTTCLYLSGSSSSECIAELEIADKDQTRIKGLSGRQSLGEKEGMLFVSDQTETQCFWMRGMLISLDMIFVDEDKKVSKIEKNIAPETYPTQFCSVQPDKYVIELQAGSADRLGIKVGDRLRF